MKPIHLALAAAAAVAFTTAAPAQEQTTPPSPENQAANVREKPVTGALNNAVQTNLVGQFEMNAEQQGQYEIDRKQYRDAVRERAAAIGADTARYLRQEEAYARAMFAWRVQTEDCRRGKLKECSKPTPVPADYY